jgi:alcohol dehydrogenase
VPVSLHLDKLWDRNISITTRLVDTTTMPIVAEGGAVGTAPVAQAGDTPFALDDIMQAYDTFEHAAREGALKVILSNDARG